MPPGFTFPEFLRRPLSVGEIVQPLRPFGHIRTVNLRDILAGDWISHRTCVLRENWHSANCSLDRRVAIERHDRPAIFKILLKAHVRLRNLRMRPEAHWPVSSVLERFSCDFEPLIEIDVIYRRVPWHLPAEQDVLAAHAPRPQDDWEQRGAIARTGGVPEVRASV